MKQRQFYIYITTNNARRPFYVGMTNNLLRRMTEHKEKAIPESFTSQYNCIRLVWYEVAGDVETAFAREKQLKGWRREKKIKLIETMNPKWEDLFEKFDE